MTVELSADDLRALRQRDHARQIAERWRRNTYWTIPNPIGSYEEFCALNKFPWEAQT